jgi:hypothetical protein
MFDLFHFEQSMTRTNVSNPVRIGIQEQATEVSQVTRQARSLRHHLEFMNADVARLHEDSLQLLLDTETDEKVKIGLNGLLVELTEECGLGWSEIAKLVKVSVPAVRKWRLGGEIAPLRLHALAQLAAFLKVLRDHDVLEPAAWLSTPLSPEVDRSLTKAALYADGHMRLLLSYADHHINLEQLLRAVGVDLDKVTVRTELVRNEDGSLSIVPLGS